VQTRRLAASFEPLNSSLPLSAPEYTRAKPRAIQLFWVYCTQLFLMFDLDKRQDIFRDCN